jgi:uncharacterized repeat protein (TIGR01451 family)
MTPRPLLRRSIVASAASRLGLAATLVVLGSLSAFADADLSLTNSSPGGVKPGDNVVYTLTVQNAALADPATSVTVSDPAPPGLTFVSFAGDCTGLTCSLGTLAATDTRTVTATFTVPLGYAGANPILNTATVTTTTAESITNNNSATAATAVTRVAGFYSLPPCRILDTRASGGVPISSGGQPLFGGNTTTLDVRGACGLPGNAIAISFNATVTQPTDAGNLRLFPADVAVPGTSSINYLAGQTRANNGIVPLSGDGKLSVFCGQALGTTHVILDANGYFVATDAVATPAGQAVVVRPAPEVEITFDNVTAPGTTRATVLDFVDNRSVSGPQDLKNFFPPGSPEQALVPSAIVPAYLVPLGKGGPAGPPTFVLSLIDSTASFARTAEFHGFEDFRLGWDPPCSNPSDRTLEPRTFYARESNEPALVEESGGPVFVDISSGCGSNKGSGWNFSAYLTARDTRSPHDIAQFMLTQMQGALSQLSAFITSGVATQIGNEVTAAINTLDSAPASSLANVDNVITIVDGNPGAFTNTTRNVSGEFVGRAMSARYMLRKFIGFDAYTEPQAFQDAIQGLTGKTTITFDNLGQDQDLPNGTTLSGASFTFSAAGFPGVATDAFLAVSQPQTLGVNRGACQSGRRQDCWFFFPGDSVTVTFGQPVKAVGAFFSSNAGAATLQEFITISTPVGTAKNHNALPAGAYGFPADSLRFVGLVSEVPFTTATFSSSSFGMVIDDITYAR